MANRAGYRGWGFLAQWWTVWARIKWAGGQPVLQAYNIQSGLWQSASASPFAGGWQLFAGVTKNSTGDITLTLQDHWVVAVGSSFSWENASGLLSAPNVGIKTAGTVYGQAATNTIEIVTSAPVTSLTGGTQEITGATGTTAGSVTTLSAGTSAAATGYAAGALVGATVTDGTKSAIVLANTAIVASGGAISGGTITTSSPLGATITATLVVTQPTTTTTSVPTDPTDGDILTVTLSLANTDQI